VPGILYAVSIEVDPEVRDDWLTWMREVHIPDVLREPGFERALIYRDAAGGGRFVIHYEITARAALDSYLGGAAARLRAEHEARYSGRARATRLVLEAVAALAPKS
jgi:hypothetical protein